MKTKGIKRYDKIKTTDSTGGLFWILLSKTNDRNTYVNKTKKAVQHLLSLFIFNEHV